MTKDNRIPEIRAYHHRVSGLQGEGEGIGSWCSCGDLDCKVLYLLDRLDALEQPAPRVFFPGDQPHGGIRLMNRLGEIWGPYDHEAGPPVKDIYVEVIAPNSGEEWQAAVDQARAARQPTP